MESFKGKAHKELLPHGLILSKPTGATIAPHTCCVSGNSGIIPLPVRPNPSGLISMSPLMDPWQMIRPPIAQTRPLGPTPIVPVQQALAVDTSPASLAVQQPVAQPPVAYATRSRLDVMDPTFNPMLPNLPDLSAMASLPNVPVPRVCAPPPTNTGYPVTSPGQLMEQRIPQQENVGMGGSLQQIPTYGAPPQDHLLYRGPQQPQQLENRQGSTQSLPQGYYTYHSGPTLQSSPPSPALADQFTRQDYEALARNPFGTSGYAYSPAAQQQMANQRRAEQRSPPKSSTASDRGICPLNAIVVVNPTNQGFAPRMGTGDQGNQRASAHSRLTGPRFRRPPKPFNASLPPEAKGTIIKRHKAPSTCTWTCYQLEHAVRPGKIQYGG